MKDKELSKEKLLNAEFEVYNNESFRLEGAIKFLDEIIADYSDVEELGVVVLDLLERKDKLEKKQEEVFQNLDLIAAKQEEFQEEENKQKD